MVISSFFVLTISTFDHNMVLVMFMDFHYFKTVIHRRENKEYLFPTLRICRVTSGEFDWKIGEYTARIQCGDMILLNNLLPRRIINQNALRIEIEVFEFSPVYIRGRKQVAELFYRERPVIVASTHINNLLCVIADAYGTVTNNSFFDHIFQAIFDLMENDAQRFLSDRKCSTKVVEAVDFIWKHYCEDISVPDVAEYLHISKNHLEKLFKDMHGIGVGEYIRIIRVYKTISLLEKNNEDSVLDIAFACGFNSSSGFYKAYKAVTGRNPRRNRNGS